jgi:PAS domain S-box-containing protein
VDWTLAISSVLQLAAAMWAGLLLWRMRNWQAAILFLLFSLMALRRLMDLGGASDPARSFGPIPFHEAMQGVVLLISVVSVAAVGFLHFFLLRRVEGEREVRFLATALADSATPTLISDAQSGPGGLVIEFANDAMLALTGFARNEMVGRTMTDVFGLDEERDTPTRVRSAVAGGLPIVTECTTRRKDGTHRWVTCSMSPIRDPSGRALRLLWVKHDITARRNVEEELRKQQERYQRIVETATEGVWLVDAQWRTTYVNARMAEMMLTDAERMAGRPVQDFMFEEDLAAHEEQKQRRERGVREQFDKRFRRADGSTLWTIMSTNPLFDERGAFNGALAMVTDIGQRRTTEINLRSALTKLSFHMDNSPLAVIEWDRDFRVAAWSSGAERIFGWTAEELVGKHPSEWRIIFEEDATKVAGVIDRLTVGAEPRNLCLNRNYTKSGEVIWCQWYNSVLFDPNGRVNSVVSLAQDVTERHRAEERQRLLMLELDHRVKNNLATVLGIAQQSLAVSTSLQDFASAFLGRVEALARAHGLLAKAAWEGVDLHELCQKILESGLVGASPQIRVNGPEVSLSASEGSILALTLHELMTNAVKYGALSCRGGVVNLSWNIEHSGSFPTLRLDWSESGGPAVSRPARAGFGTAFIETGVSYELHGSAVMDYDARGLRCRIVIPVSSKPGFASYTTEPSGAHGATGATA